MAAAPEQLEATMLPDKKARNTFMLRAFSFQTGLGPVIPHGQQGMPPTQQAAPATQQPRANAAGEPASAASVRENFRYMAFIKTSLSEWIFKQ